MCGRKILNLLYALKMAMKHQVVEEILVRDAGLRRLSASSSRAVAASAKYAGSAA
jgi:hypothetical protein